MATKFHETDFFKRGAAGELLIVKFLQKNGCFIVPSYEFTGRENNKAPRLLGMQSSYVLPDLDVSSSGGRFWAEVKTKKEPTYHRNTECWEHGIPTRHYCDYKKVEAITRCPVWIFIYEEDSKNILFQSLQKLEPVLRSYGGSKMSLGGMVFWDRRYFSMANQ